MDSCTITAPNYQALSMVWILMNGIRSTIHISLPTMVPAKLPARKNAKLHYSSNAA